MSNTTALPDWDTGWAMFLDVDGTLVDIEHHPDQVRAAPELKRTLVTATRALDGALALVSGRSIASLDRIFAPLCLPAAGLHGLERRDADGRVHYPGGYAERIAAARAELLGFVQSEAGLLLEDKGAALALHYRNAPQLEGACRRHMDAALRAAGADFHVQQGKMVLELKPSGHDKGTAILAFMAEPPFSGRVPVFIGDDLTDEDGFRAVNELGGLSVRVGAHPDTRAGIVAGDVAEIRRWLSASMERIDVSTA
ncbi:trehalose-phosphatase [Thioalkalivibrio sp. XN279]|uniref:trehalose-phosphatase n=1 Tax=Thioalkalivibrio sp. XN279 TaxID=2714953 RepID=UPI001409B746|nr:trehalose-phosphatase [Thioalkalivibrio sp. XN279]NHA13412.1 trehalose-phosphatase [Thioalkalivibrio sp. XN279]